MIDLSQQLKKFIQNTKGDNFKVSDIFWRVQDFKAQSVLFFKYSSKYSDFLEKANRFDCIITDNKEIFDQLHSNVILIDTNNWLESQKIVLDILYPSDNSKKIAITGTNGKTSTSFYLEKFLRDSGKKILRIGTLGIYFNEEKLNDFNLTTPSFIDLRKILSSYNAEYVILEASSHALEQGRFYKINFNFAAWTNFTQDHLDYHKTMEDYFKSKEKIANNLNDKIVYVAPNENIKSDNFESIKTNLVEISSSDIQKNPSLGLKFNQKNISLAFSLARKILGDDFEYDFSNLDSPEGRFNFIKYKDSLIVIDFAHTPDALEKICSSLKESFKDKDLFVLFGCGGDRDPSKREKMAKAVARYADKIVLTSDNPRFEDPEQIISHAKLGLVGHHDYSIEVDRKTALQKSISELSNHVFLIAGKGHEPYLDIKGVKYPFNDKEEILKYIHDS